MQQKLLHKATLQPATLSEATSSRRWRCKPVHLISPSFFLLGLVHLGRSHHDWHELECWVSRTSRSQGRTNPNQPSRQVWPWGEGCDTNSSLTLREHSGSHCSHGFPILLQRPQGTGKCRWGWMYRIPEQNSLGQALCKLLCRGKTADEITMSFLKAFCKPVFEAISLEH